MAKPAPFGPMYPALGAGVQKFRRMATAAGGVATMEVWHRHAYGAAVEQAILSLQRQELRREVAPVPAMCASGSFANTAEGIEKAVKGRISREFNSACRRDREGRSDETVQALYDAAMARR